MFCGGRNRHRCSRTHAHILAIIRCAKKQGGLVYYIVSVIALPIYFYSYRVWHALPSLQWPEFINPIVFLALLPRLWLPLKPSARTRVWLSGAWLEENVLAFKRCQLRQVTPSVESVHVCSIRAPRVNKKCFTHTYTHAHAYTHTHTHTHTHMLSVQYLGWNTVL